MNFNGKHKTVIVLTTTGGSVFSLFMGSGKGFPVKFKNDVGKKKSIVFLSSILLNECFKKNINDKATLCSI